jgi:hypothetical protein
LITLQYNYSAYVQSLGYVLHENDLGFAFRENLPYRDDDQFNDVLTTTAQLIRDENEELLRNFEKFSKCFKNKFKTSKSRPKFRPIDNFGNNLKHHFFGTPNTPYFRLGKRTYHDGIKMIRRSVTGVDLPSPRKIMVDVLDKGL